MLFILFGRPSCWFFAHIVVNIRFPYSRSPGKCCPFLPFGNISVEKQRELYQQLENVGKDPESCYSPGQTHTFCRNKKTDPLLVEHTVEIFERYVKNLVGLIEPRAS